MAFNEVEELESKLDADPVVIPRDTDDGEEYDVSYANDELIGGLARHSLHIDDNRWNY